MDKRQQQFISVTVRLIALLILISYLLISQLYLKEQNKKEFTTVEKETLSNNYRAIENETKQNEVEMNVWVKQKFLEYKRECENYIVPKEKMVITVDNQEIHELMTIK